LDGKRNVRWLSYFRMTWEEVKAKWWHRLAVVFAFVLVPAIVFVVLVSVGGGPSNPAQYLAVVVVMAAFWSVIAWIAYRLLIWIIFGRMK